MARVCDNKSVGILVWNEGKLLMIERKKYNFGFAIPAGHQDGDNPDVTAKKELSEEIGLVATKLQGRLVLNLPNPCKREGGTHHVWHVLRAENWHGEIKPSDEETKSYIWADMSMIQALAKNLEEFSRRIGIGLEAENLPAIVRATNEDPSWAEAPGLEPPMYFLFKRLEII